MSLPLYAQDQLTLKSPGIEDYDTHNAEYISGKSPSSIAMKVSNAEIFDGGAIRTGEAPRLLSYQSFGLLCQYAAVGLTYGILPRTIYPVLVYYLNTESIIVAAALALLDIPWAFKAFFGMLSDNLPIFGYRRRPFMMIGWAISGLSLFAAGVHPMPKPYFPDPSWRDIKPMDYTPEMKAGLNTAARTAGGHYVLLMTLATVGFLAADSAADGLVVEYAQREPLVSRGQTQTAVYTVRFLFMSLAQVIIAFGLNTPQYGGDFSFGISFSAILLILAVISISIIPITWIFVQEERSHGWYFKYYIMELWDSIQSPIFYRVIAFSFFYGIFNSVGFVAYDTMTSYWIEASSFSTSISTIISYLLFAAALSFTGKYALNWDWRQVIACTNVALVIMDAITTMLATFDIVRDQWFWLGSAAIENIPLGMNFMVQSFVVVEIAGQGNEGTVYGLITTVQNLGNPFATAIEKNINAQFAVRNDDIMNDTAQTRYDVAITIWISYSAKLFSLIFLCWLPRQKRETMELRASTDRNKWIGILTLSYSSFALVWSVLANILSMFESTQCLSITGGCDS